MECVVSHQAMALTFSVDHHVIETVCFRLFELVLTLAHFGDFGELLDVSAIGTGSKDATAQAILSLVCGGHQSTTSVVDECRALDVNVFAVESILKQLSYVLADGVLAFKALERGECGE
jgi:hypothetical protein